MTTKTRTDALPSVPGLSEAWGHCQTTESLRTYAAAIERGANAGEYRAVVGTHGVMWLHVSPRGALGTERVSEKAAPVLDAAYAAGRVSFVEDGSSLPGARFTVA